MIRTALGHNQLTLENSLNLTTFLLSNWKVSVNCYIYYFNICAIVQYSGFQNTHLRSRRASTNLWGQWNGFRQAIADYHSKSKQWTQGTKNLRSSYLERIWILSPLPSTNKNIVWKYSIQEITEKWVLGSPFHPTV
jgi:hypothetical protein